MEYIVACTAILLVFGGLGWLIYISNKPPQKKLDKYTKEIMLDVMYMERRGKMYTYLNELNIDYMLGLEDYEFEKILDADDLEKANKMIYFYMDKEPITLDIFRKNLLFSIKSILRGSNLSEARKQEIIETIAFDLANEDELLIHDIVEDFSSKLTEDFAFLRGRVNYTLCALGILYQMGSDDNDTDLIEHVNSIRKKRGVL